MKPSPVEPFVIVSVNRPDPSVVTEALIESPGRIASERFTYRGRSYVVVGFTPMSVTPAEFNCVTLRPTRSSGRLATC
jgi:hypothetical protein